MGSEIEQEFRTEVFTASDGEPALRWLTDEQVIARMGSEIERLRAALATPTSCGLCDAKGEISGARCNLCQGSGYIDHHTARVGEANNGD